MKNIGIVILSITIVGCASSLDTCYTYSKPKKDKCVINYFNKKLEPYGEILNRAELIQRNSSFTSINKAKPLRMEWIQVATLTTKRKAEQYRLSYNNNDTNPFVVEIRQAKQKKTGKIVYRAVVKAHFNSEYERQEFFIKYNAIPYNPSKEKVNTKQRPITAIYKDPRKVISSDIDSMCNELKKNYEKFSAQRKDSRVIQNAQREYEHCKREQQDLRQY